MTRQSWQHRTIGSILHGDPAIAAGGVTFRKIYEQPCEQCGKTFQSTREHARFCSAAHRKAWHRAHPAEPSTDEPVTRDTLHFKFDHDPRNVDEWVEDGHVLGTYAEGKGWNVEARLSELLEEIDGGEGDSVLVTVPIPKEYAGLTREDARILTRAHLVDIMEKTS